MMNRAIEDAADFKDMMRKLQERASDVVSEPLAHLQKRPGENRKQYRERMRRERKGQRA